MATIYKRGRSWYAQWREEGALKRQSIGPVAEAEAQAWITAKERQLETTRPASGPMFIDWALEYGTWHATEYPDSYYRIAQIIKTHLGPHFGSIPIGALKSREVEAYKHARLETGAAPATVTKEIRTLKAMINKAVEWDIIPHSGIKGVKPPRDLRSKPPQWYTKEELQALYAAELDIKKSTSKPNAALHEKYRWTWQLMAYTGLRRSEAMQLEWGDINQEGICIISETGLRTKSGKWRLIPMTQHAQEALEALKGEKKGRVLPDVKPESISRSFIRTAARAGVKGSIHCLRHSFCSHLVMRGVPLRTVQKLAGHASFITTERYAHLSPDHLRDSISLLDN